MKKLLKLFALIAFIADVLAALGALFIPLNEAYERYRSRVPKEEEPKKEKHDDDTVDVEYKEVKL